MRTSRRASRRASTTDGSAIVAALALALVLAVLAASVTARSVGAVRGAAAANDRLAARAVAEEVLLATVAALDDLAVAGHGMATASEYDRRVLGESVASTFGASADVEVGIERLDDDVLVHVASTVGTADAQATARLRPRATSDVAWMSESRARDPLLQGLPRLACTWPVDDSRRDASCRDMLPPTGAIAGPIHSNDPITGETLTPPGSSVTSSALGGVGVDHRSEMHLPRDAGVLLEGRVPTCRFRGPTLLRLDGPRVRVTSPSSVPRPDEAVDADIGCAGVDRHALSGVAVIELPERAVIEVIPDDGHGCVHHPLGIDDAEDRERSWRCDAGDVFVWGRYAGARTVIAHDSIQIVWDVEPGDAAAARDLAEGDVLGLVAGDSVVLRRPVGRMPWSWTDEVLAFAGPGLPPFGPYPLDAPSSTPIRWETPRVVAAIAALRGSFAPQNVSLGNAPFDAVVVVGSVAGRFAPALTMDLIDWFGSPAGSRELPLLLTYDRRLLHDPPPGMPLLDHGRMRIVEWDVG